MGRKRYLSKKPNGEIKTRCYEDVLEDIRKIAQQQEEVEKERERIKRLNTPTLRLDDLAWKYQEYNFEIKDNTLFIKSPIEVENFIKLKTDAFRFGVKDIKVEV